jgi:hypothetical protein
MKRLLALFRRLRNSHESQFANTRRLGVHRQ